MKRVFAQMLALCALAGCASPSGVFVDRHAVEIGGSLFFQPVGSPDSDEGLLVLDGPITPETSFSFLYTLETSNVTGLLITQSDGGNLVASHQVGDAIRARGIHTTVLGWCYSACVNIFIAGDNRLIHKDGQLGLHPASDPEFGYQLSKPYWGKLGLSNVNEAVYSRKTDELWYLSAERAQELRLATEIFE